MKQANLILVKHYCQHTRIEENFVQTLHEYGLIAFEEKETEVYVFENDLSKIERMFRMHEDLGINFEGLDALENVLKRLKKMEKELRLLRKKLNLYE